MLSQSPAASTPCLADCSLSIGLVLHGGYNEFIPWGTQLPYSRTRLLEKVEGSDMHDVFELFGRRNLLSGLESLCSLTADGTPDIDGRTFVSVKVSLDTTLWGSMSVENVQTSKIASTNFHAEHFAKLIE